MPPASQRMLESIPVLRLEQDQPGIALFGNVSVGLWGRDKRTTLGPSCGCLIGDGCVRLVDAILVMWIRSLRVIVVEPLAWAAR